jgi:hypothetical protein
MSKGGVVIMSAGNSGTFDTTAENPYIVTVSGTDSSDALASWSTTGNCVDLAAPGVSIYTTNNGGGYGSWTGTSFSSPIVAGVAALVISANPNLTGPGVRDCLTKSADDLGPAGWDTSFGWGRVNATKAVLLATGGTPTPDTTPPSVSFTSPADCATVSGTVTAQASASDNIGVASVSLYVDGVKSSTDTASPYAFTVNTVGLVNGNHTFEAVAVDAAGNTSSQLIVVNVNNVTDTTAPTVRVTSPAGGAKVGNSLTVSATATDNIGVTKVVLYVDGVLTATDTSAPYSFSVNTRKWSVGTHTIVCKAYDAAGNIGVSTSVSVTK